MDNLTTPLLIAILAIVFLTFCLVIWILAINKIRWDAEKDDYNSWEELQDKTSYIGYLETFIEDMKDVINEGKYAKISADNTVDKLQADLLDLQDEYEYTARKRASSRDTKH